MTRQRQRAHWFHSQYRYRFVGERTTGWRYADTLNDILIDLEKEDDQFEVEIQRHVRADDFNAYGRVIRGEQGPSLIKH